MTREVLECPALPAGYSAIFRVTQIGSHYRYRVDVIALNSFRTVHSLEQHSTRAAALLDAEAATREHLERFKTLYPASVRNRITTWLNTLTAPAKNERTLF